ncbi:MAG: hypothetical protein CMJ18_10305 [Phycisphaeraceae bacterium]|nr:hypothetical protein [Phycisphaeraceae bacterium]
MVGIGALVLAGCAPSDPVKAPHAGLVDLLPVSDYPQIAVASSLSEWLVFAPPTVLAASEDGPMHVSVPLRSTYDKQGLSIQYRFRFLDAYGRPTGHAGFRFAHLAPRMQDFVEANAMDGRAEDWRLEIRPAR